MVAKQTDAEIRFSSAELTEVTHDLRRTALERSRARPEAVYQYEKHHIERSTWSAFLIGSAKQFPEHQIASLVIAAAYHHTLDPLDTSYASKAGSGEVAVYAMHVTGAFGGRDFDRVARLIKATATDREVNRTDKPWLDKAMQDADVADLGAEYDIYWHGVELELSTQTGNRIGDLLVPAADVQIALLSTYEPHLAVTKQLFPHQHANLDILLARRQAA